MDPLPQINGDRWAREPVHHWSYEVGTSLHWCFVKSGPHHLESLTFNPSDLTLMPASRVCQTHKQHLLHSHHHPYFSIDPLSKASGRDIPDPARPTTRPSAGPYNLRHIKEKSLWRDVRKKTAEAEPGCAACLAGAHSRWVRQYAPLSPTSQFYKREERRENTVRGE